MNTACMSVSELRTNLGRRVDAAWYRNEPTITTSSGEPRAVLISYAEWKKMHAPENTSERELADTPAPPAG